jgi:hypothetical protein
VPSRLIDYYNLFDDKLTATNYKEPIASINKEMQQRNLLGANNVPRTVVWTEPPSGGGSGTSSR